MAKHRPLFRPQEAPEAVLPRIEQWYLGEQGQRLLAAEQIVVDQQLQNCFGYHLLQLSVSSQFTLYDSSAVQHKYRAHPLSQSTDTAPDVLSGFEMLPFETGSVDVALLHHAHEFVANPHEVLREMQRVVTPRGHLIIAGFNPWSLLGAHTLASRFRSDTPWRQHLISKRRIVDWLSLLGFGVIHIQYVFPRPWPEFDRQWLAKSSGAIRDNIHRTPFGACYIISAVKDVSTLTPVRPSWSTVAKPFAGLSPVNPVRSKEVA
jgi:SAM-dependent methyltransferase